MEQSPVLPRFGAVVVSGAADLETLEVVTQLDKKEDEMSGQILVPTIADPGGALPTTRPAPRKTRFGVQSVPFRVPALQYNEEETAQRQAELFYLQKQIQSQTPMVIVLEDGEQVEGCIEWYDRHTLKVRGRSRMLVFKSAIKYMYKQGEMGA
jgi:sRNA-binding regulator protein Hfq